MPQKAKPFLHVFLGAGGVGKTTLSAGYALALARQGFRVGLISVDPARRLKDALGVSELSEQGTSIAFAGGSLSDSSGSLKAAFLNVNACFTRWVEEEGMPPEARERLFANRLFRALVDKFATATDTFAAVRVAEWSELESFDHVVVDTAPGLHALDFLSKPDKLMAFLDSKLVDWLKWFVGADPAKRSVMHRVFKAGARRVLDGLAQIGGQNFLVNFGEFLVLLDDVFATMLRRLGAVVAWMRSDRAHFYLVTAVREDAVFVARRLMAELHRLETRHRTTVVNKAFPDVLALDPGFVELMARKPPQAAGSAGGQPQTPFLNYLTSYTRLQELVLAELASSTRPPVRIPLASGLDGTETIRLEDLVKLGQQLLGKT